jgi:hypothetical protein
MAHKHTLTFEATVPEDEAERAELHAHPKVKEAKQALLEALAAAGHPHTMSSKITKSKGATGPRKPRAVRAAAE